MTRPLIGAAENEATTMIRDNFLQPTVNALGYTRHRVQHPVGAATSRIAPELQESAERP